MTRDAERVHDSDNDGKVRRKSLFGPIDQPNLESDHIYPAVGRVVGVKDARKKGAKPVPQKRRTAVTIF